MPTIDLRELQNEVVAQVILFDDNQSHDVRAITGEALYLIKNATEDRLKASYDAVKIIVPTLAEAQIMSLTPEVVAKLIDLSTNGVAEVEQTDPNGGAPATNNSPA